MSGLNLILNKLKMDMYIQKYRFATNEFKYDGDGEKIQHTLWHQVITGINLQKK